jgi:NADPH-dependent 2,4-dienoyl-CoA reductase/sulfur reductase-like enzyme
MMRLSDYKVEYLPGHKLISITADSVILENTKNRRQREEKIDHVVLSVGVASNDKLAKELQPYYKRIYTIGDARRVGRIAQAVRDGFKTAWRLK